MSSLNTESTSGLCDSCRGVSPFTVSSIRTTATGQQLGYRHRTYQDLGQSSSFCPLCKLILDELIKASYPTIKLKKGRVHQVLLSSDKYHRVEHTRRELCVITVLVTNSNARAFLHAWADPSSDAALSGDIAGHALHPAPNSPGAFRQIQTWLETCLRSHTECNPVPLADADTSSTTRFPTRLLDVGTNNTPFVKLTDRQNALGRYAALSYCWGPAATQLRTLKSNLAEHTTTGINISAMPATLRDAVIVTRNLGLRYLWIDALCIIQNDSPDWLREAPQMGLIYQNAHLTIAATGSSSSTGGLFHPRDTTTSQPVIELSYLPPGRTKPRTFFVGPHTPSFDKVVTASVWNRRGWVLQERNLSRRIVLFSVGQLFFECIRHSVAEDGLVLAAVRSTTVPLSLDACN